MATRPFADIPGGPRVVTRPGRRVRRARAAVLAPVLAVAGLASAVALAPGPPASAAPPVIAYPGPGSTVPGNEFTATGTADELFDITIRMNLESDPTPVRCDIPAEAGVWNWTCNITGLSGGPQTLRVIQNGVETAVSFTLEGAPLLITSPPDGGVVYDAFDLAEGTADTGDSIFVELDGAPWCAAGPPAAPGGAWACSGPPITALGAHVFTVTQSVKAQSGSFDLQVTPPPPPPPPPP
ncbi:MAG TPA: hypothetical protein PK890_07160, partial [Terrimesophilobacter sp.]|nr:hypothetical protein [Terrimesophilobacter sp.]